jgi:hypothetical protein
VIGFLLPHSAKRLASGYRDAKPRSRPPNTFLYLVGKRVCQEGLANCAPHVTAAPPVACEIVMTFRKETVNV